MATLGKEEKDAVLRVIDSDNLSGYLAGELAGGPEVNALESEWAEAFGYKHAVAMNSATSGLIAAVGAIRTLNSRDHYLVSPLTMSASATAPLVYDGELTFVDIEPDYFNLDAAAVKKAIRRDTAAVIVTDLFGQAYNPLINAIARDHGTYVIEDASQRPMPGQGDLVVYSLNYHKHIHCGEGGMVCTNDDELATALKLIRNHAENADTFYFGFNFRLTELQAAIARVQLEKLPGILKDRQKRAKKLNLAPVRPEFDHAWYLFPYLENPPEEAFEYKSFLPHLSLFRNTPGHVPVAREVIERLRVVRP